LRLSPVESVQETDTTKAVLHFAALQNAQRITTAQDGRPFEPV
jgi:hypothetical protein